MHDGLGRATATASRLEAEQSSGNISKIQTKATPSGPSSLRTSLEGGPGCHVTMGNSHVQARPERQSNLLNEPPLGEGNTSRSDEGSMQLLELMDICTKLSGKVTTLENKLKSTKAVYNKALITLTKRVKKLEKKLKHKIRRAVVNSSEDEEAIKSSKQGEADETARRRKESDDTEVVDFSTASPQKDDDEETLVETLVSIKKSAAKDKGKAIMQESKPSKKIKKKEMIQISLDEEIAQRIAQENLVQAEQWDEDLAQRMLEEERKSWSIEERSRLLTEFIDKRKKMLAAKRAKEKRNKPPTQAQQRTYIRNYIKNMGGYTLKQLKQYFFEEIKMLFDQTMESIRNFVPMESEDQIAYSKVGEGSLKEAKQVVKESSKKAGGRLKRKTSKDKEDKDKRHRKQDDPEKLALMDYVEVISYFEEVISVILLVYKFLMVNWKSYCKGDVGYYEIHRAAGSYKTYIFFSEMLNDFDRENMIVLYRLFNEKYASTRIGFDDLMLWRDMKIMFEPDGDDAVWKNHHSQELIELKLYDSCGVHSLMLREVSIHMLVEKKYPLLWDTLTRMLQWKLHLIIMSLRWHMSF
nr:hypothetical protein [Tanacetum cinerariifolium]